jgi:hypothetical protein
MKNKNKIPVNINEFSRTIAIIIIGFIVILIIVKNLK